MARVLFLLGGFAAGLVAVVTIAALMAHRSPAEKRIAEMREEIARLSDAEGAAQTREDAARFDLANALDEKAELEAQLAAAEKDLRDWKELVDRALEKNAELDSAIRNGDGTAAAATIKVLRDQLAAALRGHDAARKLNSQLLNRCGTLSDLLAKANGRLQNAGLDPVAETSED
ncbi:MAG TPA: hypothetical protein VG826_29335 [Pirellulales bacterium]|nr:hypothetical protein [Pirellulales bacterium]